MSPARLASSGAAEARVALSPRHHHARVRLTGTRTPFASVGIAMRILAVSGSLQAASTNRALLELAAKRAPAGMAVLTFDGLAAIPAFNSDFDPVPSAVIAWAELVGGTDALFFATPEYAFGMPGALKNA